jgi:hypothetical protein
MGTVSPQDQIATIKNVGNGSVINVDGRDAAEGRAFLPGKLEISSEEHTLTLQYLHYSSLPMGYESAKIENYKFKFNAGKKYMVKYSLNENEPKPQSAQEAHTMLLASSSSIVYNNTWKSKTVWLWIEELKN